MFNPSAFSPASLNDLGYKSKLGLQTSRGIRCWLLNKSLSSNLYPFLYLDPNSICKESFWRATFKKSEYGTSLAVQWLRLHSSNEGISGSIPVKGIKIPHATWCVLGGNKIFFLIWVWLAGSSQLPVLKPWNRCNFLQVSTQLSKNSDFIFEAPKEKIRFWHRACMKITSGPN